jgi:hypothetical protein
LFTLYLPNRHTAFAVPIFGMMWLCALVPRVVYLPLPGFRQVAAALTQRWVQVTLFVAGAGLIGLNGLVNAPVEHLLPPRVNPALPQEMEDAFAFIRTLPKDTIVAGHPYDLDHVSLRTRRRALAWDQVAQPFHLGFYRFAKEQVEGELRACYASQWEDVDALHDRFGADVFLVSTRRYKDRGSIDYRPPFSAENYTRFRAGLRDGFILLNPPPDRILFRKGAVTVVRVGPPRVMAPSAATSGVDREATAAGGPTTSP